MNEKGAPHSKAIRLDRFLHEQGLGTRKQLKKWIRGGRVQVEAETRTDPAFPVSPGCQEVQFDGNPLLPLADITVMLFKPAGFVCSRASEGPHSPVFELFPPLYQSKLEIAGRLDADTTGLLLLSSDGALVHRIISPRKCVEKRYQATVIPFPFNRVQEFFQGIVLHPDEHLRPIRSFQLFPVSSDLWQVEIGIEEGKYHQVKRMFAHVGSHVVSLHRLQVGGLALDPELSPGEWRVCEPGEIERIFLPADV